MKTPDLNAKLSFQLIGAMALIFATLKLTGLVIWPWWILTVSLWFCSAAILVIVIISFIFAIFADDKS